MLNVLGLRKQACAIRSTGSPAVWDGGVAQYREIFPELIWEKTDFPVGLGVLESRWISQTVKNSMVDS